MKILTAMVILSISVLSACGGGGGSGGGGDNGLNTAPEISGKPNDVIRANENFSFTPQVTDRDGDLLTFSVENLPHWAFFDAGSGSVSGFPDKTHYGAYDDIVIKVSDGVVSTRLSFSIDVLPPLLDRDNFSTVGTINPNANADGYQSTGTLVMNIDGEEKRFEDSDLQLKFDAEGNLLEMVGETIIPKKVSEHMSLDAQVKTTVGYFSGVDINADPDIDILLKEEQYYFVYYYGQNLDITLKDRDGSGAESSLTISTPASGKILFITDPSDIFYYYYGEIPFVGTAGKGESDNGFIPFEPSLDYEELDSFDGHIIETASMGIGVKIFDFFNIAGTRVMRQPDFAEIFLDDPFFEDVANSANKIEYKMGINGDADFAFSILGFGLFEFDLTEVSTTFDVGFDRQHMAMRTRTAPDVSWVPSTFAFVPKSETIGDWFIDGSGDFEIKLSSTFETTTPAAKVGGSMAITQDEVVLTGTIGNGGKPLGVTATFFDTGVDVVVDVYADFDMGISQTVTAAMDDKIDEWHQAFEDLQQATADFELELSLNGFRTAIPAIVNAVIPILDAVPGTVRTEVDNAIVSYVDNYEVCVPVFGCSNPLDPLIDQNALGNSKGETARRAAANAIVPYKTALINLKNAVNASDDVFRAAIKATLQEVYNRRTFSTTIKITHSFPLGIGTKTLYNKTTTRNIITGQNLTRLKFALDNVDNIETSSSIMISAGQFYDALPVEEAINTAKQEVADGLAQIPTLDGVGYTVDNGVYNAYAILNGKPFNVQFNVLSPSELAAGIGRLIADGLI